MAEEWNTCSSLSKSTEFIEAKELYQTLLKNGQDPLGYMMNMQFDLQKALHTRLPNQTMDPLKLDTVGNKYEWLRDNKIAFDDEFAELVDALPGMSNMDAKTRTALWKKWKGSYADVRSIKFSELRPDDQAEAKYEIIDAMHFFMNMLIVMELSSEDIFAYYYTKNIENHRRANTNY